MVTDTAPEFDLGPLSWVQGEIDHALSRGVEALTAFKASPRDATALKHARDTAPSAQRAITQALNETAGRLGNTPAVVRNSYVHPGLIDAFNAVAAPYVRGAGERVDPRRL